MICARACGRPFKAHPESSHILGILIPAALALLALAVPIILFYMLRLRREELTVSSSLLWRRALQDRTANAPWQRLRRNLLLLLQLLLLLLLVLSLARPFLSTRAAAEGNMVLVLDASASMQAADEAGGHSRFDRARAEADALVDGLQGDERISIIWAGPVPSIAMPASGDKNALHATLLALNASNGRADMTSALTLAAASSRQLGEATVVLISDGVVTRQASANSDTLPQMPSRARYINVGTSGSNVGITSLSLRDAHSGPQLFAGLLNSGPKPVSAILSIYVGDKLRDSRKVDIAAASDGTVTLEGLPLDTQTVEARLSVDDKEANKLAADDRAWALRSKAPAQNVLLVTEGNSFLEKALNLMHNVKLFKVAPASYAPSDGFGLTVLDGVMPSQVPGGNLFLFSPPNSALLPVSGTIQYPSPGTVDVNDPLMRFVDLSNTHVAAANRIVLPTWARVLARTSNGEPLIVAGEPGGRRVVAVAFDLHQSDLPLQVAFPILMNNLVEWLQPTASVQAPPNLAAGDPVSIQPMPQADEIVVTTPAGSEGGQGKQTVLKPSGQVSFAGTDALGVYSVQQNAKGKPLGPPEQFAVNLFSREESNITPRPDLPFTGSQGTQAAAQTERPLEVWPWVLLASLVLLSVEWWFYNRAGGVRFRLRLPRLRRAKSTAEK